MNNDASFFVGSMLLIACIISFCFNAMVSCNRLQETNRSFIECKSSKDILDKASCDKILEGR